MAAVYFAPPPRGQQMAMLRMLGRSLHSNFEKMERLG
jgi:hypothetical protein